MRSARQLKVQAARRRDKAELESLRSEYSNVRALEKFVEEPQVQVIEVEKVVEKIIVKTVEVRNGWKDEKMAQLDTANNQFSTMLLNVEGLRK